VFDLPGSVIANTNIALQLQCGYPSFTLREQVNRQEPFSQWNLGGSEDRTAGQRGLSMAMVTLIYLAAFNLAVGRVSALRTNESIGPTQVVQRRIALLFAAIAFHEFRQTETFLELDRILRHIDTLAEIGNTLNKLHSVSPFLIVY